MILFNKVEFAGRGKYRASPLRRHASRRYSKAVNKAVKAFKEL